MCGFSVYLHTDKATQDPNGDYRLIDLEGSLKLIDHRGPDSTGTFISPCGRCGMGHARLSIIDLEGGHQPISNASGNIQCVVNGELYDFENIREELKLQNHVFTTLSDSEIALHLYEEYGLSFVEKLRGEFAICIWDAKLQRLLVVRDRYAIKPVYYTMVNGTLMAASEIKAFLAMGWKPEWDIESLVYNGPLLDNRTCFKGVHKLPPGHYLTVEMSGDTNLQSYWELDYPDKSVEDTRTVEEMVEGVKQRIIEAVRLRMKADVPCGIYLSGGIDSSCIAKIASELYRKENPNSRLEAFSIGFKGAGMLDESEIAKNTAEFCKVNYNKCEVTEEDMLNSFADCVWHSEQPQFNLNSTAKFILSKFTRDNGFKVVMTGEGSDEHFGGYAFLHPDFLAEYDQSFPELNELTKDDEVRRKLLIRMNQNSQVNYTGSSDASKGTVNLLAKSEGDAHTMLNGLATPTIMATFLTPPSDIFVESILKEHGSPDPTLTLANNLSDDTRQKIFKKWHPLHSALFIECKSLLANTLLNGMGDRSEMAHSIEGRNPFMDHHLCEYVNGLPPCVKVRPIETKEGEIALNEKWVLKEAMKEYVTEEIYNRSKHAFVAPAPKKSESTKAYIVNVLNEENVKKLGWADWPTIKRYRDEFTENGDPRIFKTLIMVMSYVVIAERFDVLPYKANIIGAYTQTTVLDELKSAHFVTTET